MPECKECGNEVPSKCPGTPGIQSQYCNKMCRDRSWAKGLMHGDLRRYQLGGCRCESCRVANATFQREQTERRRLFTPVDQIPHGSGGYSNYGCRCERCSLAHREKMRRQQERRRQNPELIPRHGTISGYQNWGCRCDPCRAAAGHAGAARGPRVLWSPEDLEILAADLPIKEIAARLGRTESAVWSKRNRLRRDQRNAG